MFVITKCYNVLCIILIKTNNMKNLETMPIELLHTDREILKIRTNLLKKITLTKDEVKTIKEINDYCNRK
jgi:hypothetical protein